MSNVAFWYVGLFVNFDNRGRCFKVVFMMFLSTFYAPHYISCVGRVSGGEHLTGSRNPCSPVTDSLHLWTKLSLSQTLTLRRRDLLLRSESCIINEVPRSLESHLFNSTRCKIHSLDLRAGCRGSRAASARPRAPLASDNSRSKPTLSQDSQDIEL
jgi:hypothetical protein